MLELNKKYGWSKFIVVVPSIAIREGVKKSFEMTTDHFMEQYGKKVRYFVYDSSNLTQLDGFSANSGINVMIINMQAFNRSMKEGARNKESLIIYSKRDEFASRRPIDVIAANNPIIIMDEPQKMGGAATQKAIENFNPLFILNYSATHKDRHDLVYVLDALDAYNQRLVKKIEVKGFEVKNFRGTDGYLYLEDIELSTKKPPVAKLELEIKYNKSTNRETRKVNVGDNLFYLSKDMEQYRGYVVSDILPRESKIIFTNGVEVQIGEAIGDVSEEDIRRIQIRETIVSHFEKEEDLFNKDIKTLSLFFIDEVAKYREYDEEGNELLGQYGKMFQEEYINILNEKRTFLNEDYLKYLDSFDVEDIHKGYFSIDKKTGKSIDSTIKRGLDASDDISAYDLILKNKERLLSFEEPTRFIFSHSALREGWDNPNVFQICTLKHSDSTVTKRQEVGRGLRLAVNREGNRMDQQTLGDQVHTINKLTVIASESYKDFVTDLQKDIKETLYERPTKVTVNYFEGKSIDLGYEKHVIKDTEAKYIYNYMIRNNYIDDDDKITDEYRQAVAEGKLAEFKEEYKSLEVGAHKLVQAIYDDSILESMIEDGREVDAPENKLNDNFYKKEFQDLWNKINREYAYKVEFDSDELIEKSIDSINANLIVTQLKYTITQGSQRDNLDKMDVETRDSFRSEKSKTHTLKNAHTSSVKYDLINKITTETKLTRRTVAKILSSISPQKFEMFRVNPEEFITKVSKLINEQKATMIVEHISYSETGKTFDSDIFTADKSARPIKDAYQATKAIQNYVFTDGYARDGMSIERKFVQDLDTADEVVVYAKLPTGFKIPTPVGDYSPDWAISFKDGSVKHIFFIAETKGTMDSMQLKPIEQAKIRCAERLFNDISTNNVKYKAVNSYENLLNVMEGIE